MTDLAEPACWSWPVTLADLDAARECPRHFGHVLLWNWQRGRCATCARGGRLFRDHDHATRLARGLLCQSCNSLEGFTAVAVPGYVTMYRSGSDKVRTFDRWHADEGNQAIVEMMKRYRVVNPASRLGLRRRHATVVPKSAPALPGRYNGPEPIPAPGE